MTVDRERIIVELAGRNILKFHSDSNNYIQYDQFPVQKFMNDFCGA